MVRRTRETHQRRVIYETIRNTKRHPTADWIYERVRETIPKVSLGTVYRNLTILKQEGLVRELQTVDKRARYDADLTPHAHFTCMVCGEIHDVEGVGEIPWEGLRDLVGCEVEYQRVEFIGFCPGCVRKGRHTN